MRDLARASAVIEEIMGKNPRIVFDGGMQELTYFIRSLSMDSTRQSEGAAMKRVQRLAQEIIQKAMMAFLKEKYGPDSSGGINGVTITVDGVFDDKMALIPEFEAVKKKKGDIVGIIVSYAVKEFRKGRELTRQIVARAKEYRARNARGGYGAVKTALPAPPPRDYAAKPPLEQLEVEMIHLEKKLPKLTQEEGRELLRLYKLFKKGAGPAAPQEEWQL